MQISLENSLYTSLLKKYRSFNESIKKHEYLAYGFIRQIECTDSPRNIRININTFAVATVVTPLEIKNLTLFYFASNILLEAALKAMLHRASAGGLSRTEAKMAGKLNQFITRYQYFHSLVSTKFPKNMNKADFKLNLKKTVVMSGLTRYKSTGDCCFSFIHLYCMSPIKILLPYVTTLLICSNDNSRGYMRVILSRNDTTECIKNHIDVDNTIIFSKIQDMFKKLPGLVYIIDASINALADAKRISGAENNEAYQKRITVYTKTKDIRQIDITEITNEAKKTGLEIQENHKQISQYNCSILSNNKGPFTDVYNL